MAIIPTSTPTAIRDRSVLTVPTLKTHLRIDSDNTTYDTLLLLYLNAAKAKADNYCQNSFRKNGEDQDIPADVEVWLLQTASKFFSQAENNIERANIESNMEISYVIGDYNIDYSGLYFYRIETGMGIYY